MKHDKNKWLLIVLNLIKNVQIKTFILECDSDEASPLPVYLPLLHRILQNQKHRNLCPHRFRQNHLLRTSTLLRRENRIHSRSQGIRQCRRNHGFHGAVKGKGHHYPVSCNPSQMEQLWYQPHWYPWTHRLHNWSLEGSSGFRWGSVVNLWSCRSSTSNFNSEQTDDEIQSPENYVYK